MEGVSIVIPAYNEENGIAPVLKELLETLDTLTLPVEVIIVNDGSKDKTGERITPFLERTSATEGEGEDNQRAAVRLIEHEYNKGYGAALKTGIRQAQYDWIMITDADGTYPNRFIPELLALREENDMVVGARIGANTNIPLIRRPPKWVLRKLASYLSGNHIPDLNSGLRLMRKKIVENFFNILPDGFSFTTTITLAMFSTGYRVSYTPIDYNKREGRSKIRPIADTLNFLKLIIRTIMYFDPLRVFLPVSVMFFLGSGAVGFGSWLATGRVMDVTTVLLFLTGLQSLGFGIFADMLNRRLP